MRIAVVANILPPDGLGGAEAYAALEAATLAEEHDVLVLSGSRAGDVGAARVVQLPGLPLLAHDRRLPVKLAWHARDQWLPAVHRATRKALAEFRPDVVHTHAIQGLSAAPFTAIAGLGAPHVHTAHDLSLMCARVTMTKEFEFCGGQCVTCRMQRAVRVRAIRRQLSTLIAVSDYIRTRHVEYGAVDAADAVVLRLGADTTKARVRSPAAGRLRVGFIGALAPHKGIRTLLSVFEQAPEGWSLIIAGAGPLADEVARRAGPLADVRFLGHVSGEAKDAFFDEIDVLAIPSEWEEPAALVGTEAAARAIPLVVSDRGGIPELPEARVFTSRDVDSLRTELAWYTREPGRVEAVSRRLLDRGPTLSWDTHVSHLVEILERAARQSRTRPA